MQSIPKPEVLTRASHCFFTAPSTDATVKTPILLKSHLYFCLHTFPLSGAITVNAATLLASCSHMLQVDILLRVTRDEWGRLQPHSAVLPDWHLAEVQLSVALPTVTHHAQGCISQSHHAQSWQHGVIGSSDQVLGLTNWLLFYSILWTGKKQKQNQNTQKDKMGGAEKQICRQIIY